MQQFQCDATGNPLAPVNNVQPEDSLPEDSVFDAESDDVAYLKAYYSGELAGD